MTKYTPNLNLPYPESADPPRGAEQMQALAERVDTRLRGALLSTEAGTDAQVPAGFWKPLKTGKDLANMGWTTNGTSWMPPVNGWYWLQGKISYSGARIDIAVSATPGPDKMLLWQQADSSDSGVNIVAGFAYLTTDMHITVVVIGLSPGTASSASLGATLLAAIDINPTPTVYVTPSNAA